MPGYVRAAERRAQLLAAAEEVLVRDGLADLTLRAVAEQAGVRLSALQYIFPTREELVSALTRHVLEEVGLEYTSDTAGPAALPVADQGLARGLQVVVEWYATVGLATPAVVEMVRYELVGSVSRHREAHAHPLGGPVIARAQHRRVEAIAEQSHEQWARPVEEIASLWADALIGLIVRVFQEDDVATFSARGLRLVDQVVTVAQPRSA